MKKKKVLVVEGKSDLDLINEFKEGNNSAFEELVSRYSEKAYHLAYRFTRNQEDAEEVLQDVFVTVYKKIDGFEGKSSFSSWLYRVTVNAGLMKIRKRKQDRSVAMDDILPQIENAISVRNAEYQNADVNTYRKQLTKAMEEAIEKLPDDYRPVFILRDVDGLTSKEVSKILNLSIPAVKSRLHRSRLMLRKKLCPLYSEYSGSPVKSDKLVGNF
jgi:RNA polymerase sigma-70 factor (ECF subfamily)